MADPVEILDFWFGPNRGERREEWFRGGPDFDALCVKYQPDWEQANAGALDAWLEAPAGLLAFIVLTDQIPRNIFRDDPRSFATDVRALAAAQHVVAKGWDTAMNEVERVFLYLPYEHAEDLATQDKCVSLYTALGGEGWLEYAQMHHDIIRQFGRFPHRNGVLGRETTAAEAAFMADHGRGF